MAAKHEQRHYFEREGNRFFIVNPDENINIYAKRTEGGKTVSGPFNKFVKEIEKYTDLRLEKSQGGDFLIWTGPFDEIRNQKIMVNGKALNKKQMTGFLKEASKYVDSWPSSPSPSRDEGDNEEESDTREESGSSSGGSGDTTAAASGDSGDSGDTKTAKELKSMSVAEVREYAKSRGLKFTKGTKKADLIEMVLNPPKRRRQKREKEPEDAPKKPQSPYFHYQNSKRAEVQKKNPGMKHTDISKEIGKMWRNEKKAVTDKFTKIAEDDKKRYERELAGYREANPEYTPVRRGGRVVVKSDKPKRAPSAFMIFSAEKRPTVRTELEKTMDKVSVIDISRELGKRWKALSDEERARWNTMAQERKNASTTSATTPEPEPAATPEPTETKKRGGKAKTATATPVAAATPTETKAAKSGGRKKK